MGSAKAAGTGNAAASVLPNSPVLDTGGFDLFRDGGTMRQWVKPQPAPRTTISFHARYDLQYDCFLMFIDHDTPRSVRANEHRGHFSRCLEFVPAAQDRAGPGLFA